MNKKFPSLHLNADDFIPATKDEKESLVVMRDSVNFWADGMRRLRKNQDSDDKPRFHPYNNDIRLYRTVLLGPTAMRSR